MALFQSRQREAEGERPQAGAADGPAQGAAAARPPRPTHPASPTQGGKEVANIGKSIAIKGDLTGNEDMVIEGKVEGRVDLPNNQLTIGANGTVEAEVTAKGIVVVGRVAGNLHGLERVEIQGTGVVEGDVCAPRLIVAEGAVVNGAIQMSKQGAAAATATARPAESATSEPADVRRAG